MAHHEPDELTAPGAEQHSGDALPAGARVRIGTNRLNHIVRAGNTGVCRIAFSAEGRYLLALGYQDDEGTLWELPSGREVWRRELGCGVDRGAGVAFGPDGCLLIGGFYALKMFDLATGRDVRTLRDGWPGAEDLAFSPCGRYLAEARYDARVDVWAVHGWQVVATLEGEPEPDREGTGGDQFCAVRFSPDGRWIAAGSRYTVKTPCTRSEFERLQRETRAGRGLGPAGGGPVNGEDWYLSRSAGRVWVWNWADGKRVNRLEGPEEGVNAVCFLPNGRVAAGSEDQAVWIWDIASGRELRSQRWADGGGNPFPAAFRPDGGAVAVLPRSGTTSIRVLDTETGAEIGQFPHSYYLAWRPDGRVVATADEGLCHLWDTDTGADLSPPGRHRENPVAVEFSGNGRRVLTVGNSRSTFVWDAATGVLVATVPPALVADWRSLSLSPDGTYVGAYHGPLRPEAGDSKEPYLYVWDIESGRVREFPLDSEPRAAAWRAAGLVIATGNSLLALDGAAGALSRLGTVPTGEMRSLRTVPDGRIVGCTRDRVYVWDADGQLSARALPPGDRIDRLLAIAPDGASVAVLRAEDITTVLLDPADGPAAEALRSPAVDCAQFRMPDSFGNSSSNVTAVSAEFLSDGRLLVAACGGDPESEGPYVVKVWEAASGREVWESPAFPHGISEVVFAPGARCLAVVSDATTVLFDVPVRPIALDPAWLTTDAVALARGIVTDGAFDRLPILADALQDAGCEDADVLDHLRSRMPTRGQWVVDLVLGKE